MATLQVCEPVANAMGGLRPLAIVFLRCGSGITPLRMHLPDIADYSAVSAFAAALPAPPTEAALTDQMDQGRSNKAEDHRDSGNPHQHPGPCALRQQHVGRLAGENR
jgi:hypothetical protein